MAARNAVRGAWSMLAMSERTTRRLIAAAVPVCVPGGSGMSINITAAGRCVYTMVRIRPRRAAMGMARSEDEAETREVKRKRVPRVDGLSECLVVK